MDGCELDRVNRQLVHALQVDGRAPLSRIGSVIGVSDRTLGHRYRRLRELHGLRVVAVPNSRNIGVRDWLVRIRQAGETVPALAAQLARRQDVTWVGIAAAGTEIMCIVHTLIGEEDAGLWRALRQVPRAAVITTQCLLQPVAGATGWQVRTEALDSDEVSALRPHAAHDSDGERVELQDGDWRMLRALSKDGRLGFSRLAEVTGWSEASARRRLATLRHSDAVRFTVEIAPALFGYEVEAMVWLKVTPMLLSETSAALARHPEVAFAAHVTGDSNLMAMVMCRDTQGLSHYMLQQISLLPGVLGAEAQIVVRRTKRAGSPPPALTTTAARRHVDTHAMLRGMSTTSPVAAASPRFRTDAIEHANPS
ncbi:MULTISPECIES: Lrp/AsnC family transcriptional regulator [Streptomyces]|uniref:Lrp/AsnC family transcriptional regulator n=1 Tax=Streptomyces TaxID=1883 RepID=UPI00163C3E29|nr:MULTISPECIES: AsnC family transcriptional regulator [Streptomyces]MBC2876715.1 Lrp/AsnC family transcriptional regulator [Streptomyces sp. TYQ1024]UBI36343.1 Lrp/AsnC family transcriptional regulator [Streptomyces mobaraensis]UKW28937.1 Lrp/AsnC family transcriptional regulator [Streptomyces sp. TYQ1024]